MDSDVSLQSRTPNANQRGGRFAGKRPLSSTSGRMCEGAAVELEQLLARVAAGESEFRPAGDSPDALQEFRQTVDAAGQAFMRGYIASLDTQSGPSFDRQCTRAVRARHLTEKGLRFLARTQAPAIPVHAMAPLRPAVSSGWPV